MRRLGALTVTDRVLVTCGPPALKVIATLTRSLRSRRSAVSAAWRAPIRIGARHSALTALRRLRRLRVSVTITFSAGGPQTTTTKAVTVKAPKRRKHRRS